MKVAGVMGYSWKSLRHCLLNLVLGIADEAAYPEPQRGDRLENSFVQSLDAALGQGLSHQDDAGLFFAHDVEAVIALLRLHPIQTEDQAALLKELSVDCKLGRLSRS